ncbi:MAG: hypothetical protein LBM93_10380 [Oscillospiraceae bacterium]|nr:hypothetical protein [Oscillospiraceae bacterium]
MIRILLGGERTSIPILARNLETSVSTIKRDLLVLTVDRGYPIMTEQGHGGGVACGGTKKTFSARYSYGSFGSAPV